MQEKLLFRAIFLVEKGISRGRNRKVHPKTPRAFRGLPEQDSQEEGERQYRMYQSDRKGTRGEIREH